MVRHNKQEVVKIKCIKIIEDRSVDFKFGSSPVSSLGVVSNFVIGFISEPVGEGSVLSLLLGQTLLHQQAFVGTHLFNLIIIKYLFIFSFDYVNKWMNDFFFLSVF
jgi:hypothetical protein